MTRVALGAVALTVAGLGATFALARGDASSATVAKPAQVTHPVTSPRATCSRPAPTTAAGYAAMFAALPASQWGAADVSISTKVGTTDVWLFGDTLSGVTSWSPYVGRFVHSTIVTQVGGCPHVSHAGAQTLPNDADGSWYWIKAAVAVDSTHLRITADRVVKTGSGPWDFATVGERTATAVLATTGDVTFQSWTGGAVPVQNIVKKDGPYPPWSTTVSEVSNGKVLVTGLPSALHHFSYAPSVHQEMHLASGKTLLTVCQNETPNTGYANYRALFFEVAL